MAVSKSAYHLKKLLKVKSISGLSWFEMARATVYAMRRSGVEPSSSMEGIKWAQQNLDLVVLEIYRFRSLDILKKMTQGKN